MNISPLQIGALSLRNNIALAPMAGLSDVPFRAVAWRMGAGYMVSEMVSSKVELWETGKSRQRRVPVPGVSPVAVQIAGTDPQVMAEAARRHVGEGVQIIDINFGCPAKKVCRRLAGSALLGDIKLIGRIVSAVYQAVPVPITIKTRIGLTRQDSLGIDAACVAVDNGAQMVVMHGRSRACKFNGAADYAPIQVLKSKVSVPVLVNGDIDSVTQAEHALSCSAADGLMIGRGALGQPWIFSELLGRGLPSERGKWQIILGHINAMHEFYGEESGVRIARKHVIAYLRRMGLDAAIAAVVRSNSAQQQIDILRRLADESCRAATIGVINKGRVAA